MKNTPGISFNLSYNPQAYEYNDLNIPDITLTSKGNNNFEAHKIVFFSVESF